MNKRSTRSYKKDKRGSVRSFEKEGRVLVGPRAKGGSVLGTYSRFSEETGYAKQRRKRSRRKKILIGSLITLFALIVAGAITIFYVMNYMNSVLGDDLDLDLIDTVTVEREKPEDPFWVLLVGLDNREYETYGRTDTILLARIDPGHKKIALVSIPRDTKISFEGYGNMKINEAFFYGELENGHSGPEYLIKAVSELTGVGIAGYAQIDFDGFVAVVDALNGVEVNVPVNIYAFDPPYSNTPIIYKGLQILKSDKALIFVRSRDFALSDYQRQANQRTFLQALAKQILAADAGTLINTLTKLCQMTSTNLKVEDITSIASDMRGMVESDIHTYTIACYYVEGDPNYYEVPDMINIRGLFDQLEQGNYPDREEYDPYHHQAEIPDEYKAKPSSTPQTNQPVTPSAVNTSDFVVDTRNGWGIPGSATSVSDMLMLAGYRRGDIGNANSLVYAETLIVYLAEKDKEAAEDIRMRLGYGRVIPSLERYSFTGDILVIVGADFQS